MQANQIADVQISLQYATACIESLKQEQMKLAERSPISFTPEIAAIVRMCVETKTKFNLTFAEGELDVVKIFTDNAINGDSITVQTDGTAYTFDTEWNLKQISLTEVMKQIVGW
jgi:hypothetical protein